MKASSRIIAACAGLSLSLAPGGARADWRVGALRSAQGMAALGQAAPAAVSPQDARRQVTDLLVRARQAMKEGRLETADSLISRAEGFNVPFGALHVGDTPKKARRELNRLRGGKQGGPQRPSELFAPQNSGPQGNGSSASAAQATEPQAGKSSGLEDPFAQRPAPFEPRMDRPAPAGFDANDPRLIDAPPQEEAREGGVPRQAFPQESPFGKQAALAPPEDDASEPGITAQGYRSERAPSSDQMLRAESDKLLVAARRSLAVGDVRRATDLMNQAKALEARYEYQEDSPAKVEAAIQRFAEMGDPRANKNSELFRRRQADSLLEQAEGLLYWQELDEAERLVNDAKRLNVPYSPVDANPDMLLERIAAARQGRSSDVEPLPPVDAAAVAAAGDDPAAREQASRLVAGARAALKAGDLDRAQALAEQAEELHVPDAAFQGRADQDRPWNVLLDIQQMRRQQRGGVRQASGVMPIGAESPSGGHTATQALYDRASDRTRNVPAAAQMKQDAGDDAKTLFDRGEAALKQHDTETALRWFREANQHRADLDPATQQRLQDHLQFLAQPRHAAPTPDDDGTLLHATAAEQQRKYRQVATELDRKERAADRVRADDPKQAAKMLEECRTLVEKSDLDTTARGLLMRRVDRKLEDLEKYVQANRGKIELNERNNAVRGEIERERQTKIEVQDKLAQLVDEFNKLMHENRFAEAEVVYKKAAELAPDELVVTQLKNTVKMVARTKNNAALREEKENGVFAALESVEKSVIPMDDRKPYQFGPVKDWKEMTKRRSELLREARTRRSERDIEIEKRLKTPVSLKYHEAPLSQVVEDMGKLANINVYLDARGLGEEAVDTNTPVTIDLSQDISLESALKLILEPLHLSYVVKNEVLMITSAQLRDGEVFAKTYNVADLVTPIPNFVPNARMGLTGALHEAQSSLPMNWGGLNGDAPMPVLAGSAGAANTVLNPQTLAQVNAASSASITPASGAQLAGVGAGGVSGTLPDFESLIELITSTIAPTTWDDVGGPGSVTPFQGNLSLVISQTQEVHEEIADLLEQLRRLQDLQVTIEVRFITLNDNYFERIGVNFDFEIPTYLNKPFQLFGRELGDTVVPNSPSVPAFPPPYTNNNVAPIDLRKNQGVTVGLQPSPTGGVLYSSDLDIPFQQGSFGLATPQFGGYQAGAGATLGFAILSQIEAYLLIEASQGDRRSNVLQAPKVTLFNGQAATVADTTQTPFVVSVIPVVGAFAAAQQPVIMVLNEGTALTVQAVVSNDRRFVRLTLIPFFSNIGQVNTFTFTGSSSTTQNSDSEGPSDNTTKRVTSTTTAAEGTTVQLPSFSFFTVATTVSVPDGGTVLLGGVKRLSEGRNEFGVPLLSKIPYVNRLFRNVGIGRETQSLMMMVTPRIIIQEEEEAMLGLPPTP